MTKTMTIAPYTFTMSGLASGIYQLKVVATDNRNETTTSSYVNFFINKPPVITWKTPLNNSSFTAGSTIPFTVSALDPDGLVENVKYYKNGVLLGTSLYPPYSYNWTNVPYGTYKIKAIATDSKGSMDTTAEITVLINKAPVVSISSPLNNAVILYGTDVSITATASDADGTIGSVKFYINNVLAATKTVAPYSFVKTGLASGSYQIKAVATDNKYAATTSSIVTISVTKAPSVTLLTPSNGSSYGLYQTVTLTASASDPDGSIANVKYYRNNVQIATKTVAPYSFGWNTTAAGTYILKAVAADNNGAIATSSAYTVYVR